MSSNLLSDLINSVTQRTGNPRPRLIAGESYDVGGMRLGSKPLQHWLVVGTEAQLFTWRDELVDHIIVDDLLSFDEADGWNWQAASMADEFGEFFAENGEGVGMCWVTPFMSLIGRQLKAANIQFNDSVRRSAPILPSRGLTKVPIGSGYLNPKSWLFASPDGYRTPLPLQIMRRRRNLQLPDGRLRTGAAEIMVCRADPHDHDSMLARGQMPPVAHCFVKDVTEKGTGSIWAAHITLIKVVIRNLELPTANVFYRAFRFDLGNTWALSYIRARDDFDGFVNVHPALRRMIESGVDSGEYLGRRSGLLGSGN